MMKILLLRVGRMGDMIMLIPALLEIRSRYPQAKIYIITSKDGKKLLPLAGIDSQNIMLYRHGFWLRILDAWRIKKFMAAHQFRHVFCFDSKKRNLSWLPMHDAKILQALTFGESNVNHELRIGNPSSALWAPFPRFRGEGNNVGCSLRKTTTVQHYATRCLQLVDPHLKPQYFQKDKTYLHIDPKITQELNQLLKSFAINARTILIGLHPSYSGVYKWGQKKEQKHRLWPIEHFVALADQLSLNARQQGLDLKIVINLLPQDRKMGEKMINLSKGNILLLPNFTHFQMYLAYIKRLQVLVVPNTGVMHLAAALGTFTVALFSKLNPEDCGPYVFGNQTHILRAEETKHPHLGLAAISVERVVTAIEEFQR